MSDSNIHSELTTALRLFKIYLKDYAAKQQKPDGTQGVTPSLVIRVAKGQEELVWLRDEIERLISEAHDTFKDFYAFHSKKAVFKSPQPD